MTYNVVILRSARYEYESIVGYLAQILKNPRAAGNFVAEFEYQLDLLREQPLLRPLSHMQELAARNYRSFPVNNYVCLYKFEHETIYIAHIFHQSRPPGLAHKLNTWPERICVSYRVTLTRRITRKLLRAIKFDAQMVFLLIRVILHVILKR